MERIDCHVHYNPKDENSAFVAIDSAVRQNVKVMALLARGYISENFSEFVDYGSRLGVCVLPAVELLMINNDSMVEGICLGFSEDHPLIVNLFSKQANKNQNKFVAAAQMKFLELKGFSISPFIEEDENLLKDLLEGEIQEKAINFCEIVSRNDCNSELISKIKNENNNLWRTVVELDGHKPKYADREDRLNARFLYSLYFAVGREGYIPIQKDVSEIIDTVHRAKGVVLYSPEGKFKKETWFSLCSKDIDGIMAWHGGRLGMDKGVVDIDRKTIVDIKRGGYLVLGGSDYQEQDWQVGVGDGSMYISSRRYRELLNYLYEKR